MIKDIEKCSKELLTLLDKHNIKYYTSFLERLRTIPASPDLEQVRKYFRDELKMDVVVDPKEIRGFLQWIGAFRYTNRTINNHFHEVNFSKFCDTYEEALDQTLILAIKYEKSK